MIHSRTVTARLGPEVWSGNFGTAGAAAGRNQYLTRRKKPVRITS